MGKRKKPFVEPPIILHHKFWRIKDIHTKSMFGQSESLCKQFFIVSYTLLIGKPPFETTEVKSTYKKIKACNYSFP